MTKIKAFRALHYNSDVIGDFSSVVCPPYDVISASAQESFRKLSPYNLIHILLGKDIPGEDKYRKAAACFNDWQKSKMMIRDDQPAIFLYEQNYVLKGEKKTRIGFIALLRLEDKNARVFAHEFTRSEAKEDRLKLVKAVRSNLSPIFAVFQDNKRIIQRVSQSQKNTRPFIDIVDSDLVNHKLWRIDSPKAIETIEQAMNAEDIFIADGHHRYEVGLLYRDLMKQKAQNFTGEEGFNYILCYFTNDKTLGLTILPIHRLVRLPAKFDFQEFKEKLGEFFDIEEIKDKTKFFFLMEKGGRSEHLIGMYKEKKFWLLRLKNIKTLDKLMPDKPPAYRAVDVAILNSIVLNRILGFGFDDKESLEFIQDPEELTRKADSAKAYIGFILNPVRMQQIIDVALTGNRMPPKSTYFYPKVLSGLVINKFSQD